MLYKCGILRRVLPFGSASRWAIFDSPNPAPVRYDPEAIVELQRDAVERTDRRQPAALPFPFGQPLFPGPDVRECLVHAGDWV